MTHAARMERWDKLSELAREQRQLVATWQAGELGIGHSTMLERVQEGGWNRVRHRVYLLPGARMTPEAEVLAALLALREPVLPSGWSAAFIWGLTDRLRYPIEVVTPVDRNVKAQGVRVRTLQHFGGLETCVRRGIELPVVGQAVCLLAARATFDELVGAISRAHRMRLALPGQIRQALNALGSFTGVVRLRRALDDVDKELTHSNLEKLGRSHLHAAGMAPHPRPFTVTDEYGRLIAEVDIAFTQERVAVEILGPPHEGREQADHDRRRRLERLGWTVIMVYEQRLRDQPHIFVAEVRRALTEARAA